MLVKHFKYFATTLYTHENELLHQELTMPCASLGQNCLYFGLELDELLL